MIFGLSVKVIYSPSIRSPCVKPNIPFYIFMISVFGKPASSPRDMGGSPAMNASALSEASKLSHEAGEDDDAEKK